VVRTSSQRRRDVVVEYRQERHHDRDNAGKAGRPELFSRGATVRERLYVDATADGKPSIDPPGPLRRIEVLRK
jgi:hypothetical protein